MSENIKDKFNENIKLIITITIFLVAIINIIKDYAAENGLTFSTKIVILYMLYPGCYILSYSLFLIWAKKFNLDKESLNLLNNLVITSFFMIGLFIIILALQDYLNKVGLLKVSIMITLLTAYIIAIIILVILLTYPLFQKRKRPINTPTKPINLNFNPFYKKVIFILLLVLIISGALLYLINVFYLNSHEKTLSCKNIGEGYCIEILFKTTLDENGDFDSEFSFPYYLRQNDYLWIDKITIIKNPPIYSTEEESILNSSLELKIYHKMNI